MEPLFSKKTLPLAALEQIGLYQDGQILLEPEAMQALLSGRRTPLIPLRELAGPDFTIERLDARLSLAHNPMGEIELLIHPIYAALKEHPLLTREEMQDLIDHKREYVSKTVMKEAGRESMYNIEYDELTRDFVGYDVSLVQAPDLVNGMFLTQDQKAAFSRGERIALKDGTTLEHRASEPLGIRSDHKALILSVLLDGGISYLLLRGIRALNNSGMQHAAESPAFLQALSQMEGQDNSLGLNKSLSRQQGEERRKMSR